MLKKTDLLVLLNDISKTGINVDAQVQRVLTKPEIPIDVIKFINDNRQLRVTEFYEQLRKSYNAKRSSLYINLMKEEFDPLPALATLSSLNLQIILFAKHLPQEDIPMFFSHVRATEITKTLNNYYTTFDLEPVINILKVLKADIKSFEAVSR